MKKRQAGNKSLKEIKNNTSKIIWTTIVLILVLVALALVLKYPRMTGNYLLTSGYVNSGYGNPLGVFAIIPDRFVLSAGQDTINLPILVRQTNSYIYRRAYFYNARINDWVPFNFTNATLGDSNWINGTLGASTVLKINATNNLVNGDNYVAVYVCNKTAGAWTCGCESPADKTCGKWMLQVFSVSGIGAATPPSGSCATDADCNFATTGKRCDMGQCKVVSSFACTSDANCSSNQVCRYNTCINDPAWNVIYDSGLGLTDRGYGIALDFSGNIYSVGESYNDSSPDFLILKYNPNGHIIWSKTFNGSGVDTAKAVTVDKNTGEIYLTGVTDPSNTNKDVWTMKLDSNGNPIWNKTFNNLQDYGNRIALDYLGNVYVVGYTSANANDILLLKYNTTNGNLIWSKTFGGLAADQGNDLAITPDGNSIYLAGYTASFGAGNNDAWTIKLDNNGNHIWNKTFGYSGNDWAMGLALDSSENVSIGGYSSSIDSSGNILILKYNKIGDLLWNNSFGSSGVLEYAFDAKIDDVGNIYVGGTRSNLDTLLVKFDSNGIPLWNKSISQPARFTRILALTLDSSGNFVYATGWSKSIDVWTMKYFT